MPQPDSSRNRPSQVRWKPQDGTWPIDPELPRQRETRGAARKPQPKEEPSKDGRTPDDRDGNEELEREVAEEPSSRRAPGSKAMTGARRGGDAEAEEHSEWVATQPFTQEDELDDTWPNVPSQYLDR
jgi:hypothetical protein